MDGIHDMGGMDGFGPLPIKDKEPVFHAAWEARVWAMNTALGAWGIWNIDAGRYTLEQLDPTLYLSSSYYQRWLYRTENLLVDHDLVSRKEIETPPAQRSTKKLQEPLSLDEILIRQSRARSARLDDDISPKFHTGDQVRVRNIHPEGHTRVPGYVRGKTGLVDRDHGVFIFPDTNAVFDGKSPQHLYSIRFEVRELWGATAVATDKVYVDMWDDYLEAV